MSPQVTKEMVEEAFGKAEEMLKAFEKDNPPGDGKVWVIMGDGKLYQRTYELSE